MANGFGAPPGQPAGPPGQPAGPLGQPAGPPGSGGFGTPQSGGQSFGAPQSGGQSFGAPQSGGQSFGAPQSDGYGAPAPAGGPFPMGGGSGLSPDTIEKAASLRWWMKLYGITQIVVGAIYCASLVGIVFGWFPILLGYWTLKAGEGIAAYAERGDRMALEESIGHLRNKFMAMGIMILIGIGLTIITVAIYVLMLVGMIGAIGFAGASA